MNEKLYEACKSGSFFKAELAINNGATDFNWGLLGACEGGHLKLVLLMIIKGANDFNNGLLFCPEGDKEISKLMIFKGSRKIWYLENDSSTLRYFLKYYYNDLKYEKYENLKYYIKDFKTSTYEDPVYVLLINKVLNQDLIRLLNGII